MSASPLGEREILERHWRASAHSQDGRNAQDTPRRSDPPSARSTTSMLGYRDGDVADHVSGTACLDERRDGVVQVLGWVCLRRIGLKAGANRLEA